MKCFAKNLPLNIFFRRSEQILKILKIKKNKFTRFKKQTIKTWILFFFKFLKNLKRKLDINIIVSTNFFVIIISHLIYPPF
jgi:hypothetical protein